jgi:UDP-GlcNAc:undecaprenyl-phosphate GlcNAc-1-phosphate transferase
MADVYFLTLGLAVACGFAATLGLLATSRLLGLNRLIRTREGRIERARWGGVAIFAAFAITPFIASALSDHAAELFSPKSGDFLAFLGACALVFAIGFFDDWKMLSWRTKLLAQVAAASAVYSAGYEIDALGLPWGRQIDLGILAPLATIVWIIFFTNAINLIDGRDGVALGVAILAAVTLAQVGANANHPTVALLLVAVAGAGLGLLPFNLPPASVYIGDSGAMLLGFIVGSLSIRAATGVTDAVFVAVPLVALGFPILDTLLAFVRRSLDHRHPLMGDEDHIHHRLELSGFGPRGLVIVIYGVSALFAGGAMVLHHIHVFAMEMGVLLATLVLIVLILTRLGYVLSLWNSASIVWLRRRLRWLEEGPAAIADQIDPD